MYRKKTFREQPLDELLNDIRSTALTHSNTRRVFLADGDALYRDTNTLIKVLNALYKHFPLLERVSSYALPNNLISKTSEELKRLKNAGLSLIYFGIETGSAMLLKCISKGTTPTKIKNGLQKALNAGMHVSATVILGLGGKQHWQEHIEQTAELVNALNLTYLSTLKLTLGDDIRDEFFEKFSRQGSQYTPQNDLELLREQMLLISLIEPAQPLIFRSNHASNALPLKGSLPHDRNSLLAELNAAGEGKTPLIPARQRGL